MIKTLLLLVVVVYLACGTTVGQQITASAIETLPISDEHKATYFETPAEHTATFITTMKKKFVAAAFDKFKDVFVNLSHRALDQVNE